MNTLNRKNISVALFISLAAIFSTNVSATETNTIESSVSAMVLAQGQQVMSDLSEQIQASISEEINSFSIDFSFDENITESLAWLTDEESFAEAEEVK